MAHRFRDDYVTLGLEDSADWASAQIHYRRQVNRWHPDRFAQRPRERLHAEQRFIQLTKAFERIRAFYRINSRLPFEAINKDLSIQEDTAETSGTGARKPGSHARDIERPTLRKKYFDQTRTSDARASGPLTPSTSKSRKVRQALMWLVPGAMVVGTSVVFFVLDRNAQRANLEEARKHLIEQKPSEYMPSAAEVHNRNRRGAFVEGDDPGKMGDMLMPDVFR